MKNLIIKPRVLLKNGIGTVFLIAMIFFVCFSVQGKEHGEDIAPLPKIFQPLAWNTNLKEIKRLFPKAGIAEMEYNTHQGKTKAIGISGVKWKYLGDATIGIEHDDYRKIKRVHIETSWSRHKYTKELVRAFTTLKKAITNDYGSPRGPVRPVDSTDPREQEYTWQEQGYQILLSINVDEEGVWAVSLWAIRNEYVYK